MLFNPYKFIFFLTSTLVLFHLASRRSKTASRWTLLVCSLAFYSYWNPNNLALILFSIWYFRHEADSSIGGEVSFYRFKKERSIFAGKQPLPQDVELIESAAHKQNFVVLFINSPLSVHGVMPRPITDFGRRYVDFSAECHTMPNDQLFDRPQSLSWQRTRAFDYVRQGELNPVFVALKRRMLS